MIRALHLLFLFLCLTLACSLVAPVHAGPVAEVTVTDKHAAGSGIFAFGGGVWRVPKVQRLAEPLLTDLGEGGTWRAALAWEVLAAADRPADIDRLLQAYPLNDFLLARARAGGQIIITLDAMPRFLARETSREKLADGPLWAHSATDDLEGWADVCARIARHFRSLGITPIYEVWNEPDHAFRGSLDDYVQLYRATALGVLRADPDAKLAGPAVSDWGAARDGQRFVTGFLSRAAQMPVPELGLSRLPVDAITYHAFNRVPWRHHARVLAEAQALLDKYGYPRVPVICSEWNVAAEPPYPEGDLNGTYPGAAHAVATVISMAEAGISGQVFQMSVDPGSPGYSAGVLSAAGTPKPVWYAFEVAHEAAGRGEAMLVRSSDPLVRAVAFRQGKTLAVLLAVFPPTDLMLARDAMEPVAFDQPKLFAEINRAGTAVLAGFMLKGGPVPAGLSDAAVAALKAGRQALRDDQARREPWRNGGEVHLVLPTAMQLVQRRVLDAETAPDPKAIAAADLANSTLLRRLLAATETELRAQMSDAPSGRIRLYGDALASRLDGRAEMAGDPALERVDRAWVQPMQAQLAAEQQAQNARQQRPVANAGAADTLNIDVQPYSVQLLIFQTAVP